VAPKSLRKPIFHLPSTPIPEPSTQLQLASHGQTNGIELRNTAFDGIITQVAVWRMHSIAASWVLYIESDTIDKGLPKYHGKLNNIHPVD
jgi:hypothetical protein